MPALPRARLTAEAGADLVAEKVTKKRNEVEASFPLSKFQRGSSSGCGLFSRDLGRPRLKETHYERVVTVHWPVSVRKTFWFFLSGPHTSNFTFFAEIFSDRVKSFPFAQRAA